MSPIPASLSKMTPALPSRPASFSARIAGRFSRGDRLLGAALLATVAIVLGTFPANNLFVPTEPLATFVVTSLALVAAHVFFEARRNARLADLAKMALWSYALISICPLLFFVSVRCGAPLADARLRAADAALGFDTAHAVSWSRAHAWVDALSWGVYQSLGCFCFGTIAFLSLRGERRSLERMLIALVFCAVVTALVTAVIPAIGPWEAGGFTPSDAESSVGPAMNALKSAAPYGANLTVSPIVCSPSWHVIFALLTAMAWRPVRRGFGLALGFSVLISISTLTTGWHYLVDVLSGGLVAVGAYAVAGVTDLRVGPEPLRRPTTILDRLSPGDLGPRLCWASSNAIIGPPGGRSSAASDEIDRMPGDAATRDRENALLANPGTRWLSAVFFLSGFSALLYQVVWQRSLFAIYGINVESVTVVVTAFMVGLGLGNLLGGRVSAIRGVSSVLLFSLVELFIGVYGLASLYLFRVVGSFTLDLPLTGTFFVTFLLVLLPTMAMGCTLPLLIAHFVRIYENVGRSVAMLYYVNTMGSAVASLAAVVLLLKFLGQSGTVRLAVLGNVTVSAMAYLEFRRGEKNGAPAVGAQ